MAGVKLAFIADIHHYSERLGNSGRAYELREGSDQKCLKETGAIIDAAFARFKEEKLEIQAYFKLLWRSIGEKMPFRTVWSSALFTLRIYRIQNPSQSLFH